MMTTNNMVINPKHYFISQNEYAINIGNVESLKESGFGGFNEISELILNPSSIPKIKGVFIVLRPSNSNVEFVENGSGGFYKGMNPNVEISILTKKWIDKANIMYINSAGDSFGKATLHSEIIKFLSFGKGNKIAYWSGRYIWQIKDNKDYIICWKELPNDWPKGAKINLMELFRKKYGGLPFANLEQ